MQEQQPINNKFNYDSKICKMLIFLKGNESICLGGSGLPELVFFLFDVII
ncbi:hypothetical protein M153_3020007086 [Pseudoloma neurophilia]|uniref:Uncharacterized protein n=1 Tax=Pseudoloma neurophilia TaxID=146866 RepID=A0A0R0LY99_9MICR|nr:hypothetical protein M153_3020007086 [Pseudoloma neurophilia]